MNRKVLLAGLAIAIPVIVLLFVSLGRDPHKVRSPLVGRAAPAFTLREAGAANRLSVEALRGTPVVLNFWATYCIPCIAEHGLLTQASSQLGSRVRFVGVVYDDREDRILDFLRTYGSAYPTLVDEGGKTAIAYGVYGVPETFFIDGAGTIVAKFEGPLTPEMLSRNLSRVMGER